MMKYTLIPRSHEDWKKKPSWECLQRTREEKAMKKRNSKYKKEEIKNPKKEKEINSFKEPRPPTRQDTQAHGEVPQPDDPAQSVVTSAQDPYM